MAAVRETSAAAEHPAAPAAEGEALEGAAVADVDAKFQCLICSHEKTILNPNSDGLQTSLVAPDLLCPFDYCLLSISDRLLRR